MGFIVKEKLEKDEYNKVTRFLDSLDHFCVEQYPDWNDRIEIYPHVFLLGTDENGQVNCFANIVLTTRVFKTAKIKFGPAFSEFEVLTDAIDFLHNYFSTQRFIYFSIQIGTFVNNKTELLEYNINRNFKVKYFFKPENLWASISVDLTKPETEILRSFSRGHRKPIKSSLKKHELNSSVENDPNHLNSFIELYCKMKKFRKLYYDKDKITRKFNNINEFLADKKRGFIEYIFEGDILVGGLVIFYQGNSATYFKAAADPERRDIPIMHFGVYEAIKICKEKGYLELDLGGYNHFVDENDQIFKINQFKRGFGGVFTFFPKQMNFVLRPVPFRIYNFLKGYKDRIWR